MGVVVDMPEGIEDDEKHGFSLFFLLRNNFNSGSCL